MEILLIIIIIISFIISCVLYLNALCEGDDIDRVFDCPIFTMCLHTIGFLIPIVNILCAGYFYNKMK